MSDDAYWVPKLMPGQDKDVFNRINDREEGLYQIDRQTVVPVKYLGGDQIIGFQVMMGRDTTAFQDWKVTLTVRDEWGGGAARFTLKDDDFLFQPNTRGFEGTLSIDALMEKSKASINQNLFQLEVDFKAIRGNGSPIRGTERTEEPLHVLVQKAVLLLPEMMGSSLWIDGQQCWPQPQADQLEELQCNHRGVPINQASKIAFNWPDGSMDPQACERQLQEGLPRLKYKRGRKSETVPYYRLQGYPYDWRLPVKTVIDQLLDDEAVLEAGQQKDGLRADPEFEGRGRHPATPPSIATLLHYLKQNSPFLADKVALIGHGIGGLIVNGAIRRPGVEDVVDRAFGVSTPFFGTLTAYEGYLSGVLSLGDEAAFGLDRESFLTLAPNLPMLYCLAPSHQFPHPVATMPTSTDGLERLSREDVDASTLIERLGQYTHTTINTDQWNHMLAAAADQFYRDCEMTPSRLDENCYLAMYALAGPESTINHVSTRGRSREAISDGQLSKWHRAEGDSVVPLVSLQGTIAREALYQLEESATHLSILGNESLWSAIAERLVDWVPVAVQAAPPEPWEPEQFTSWVAFEVVDEDGQPLAQERYRVELADGTVHEGQLDATGQLLLDEIVATGPCTISFPDIDGGDWLAMNGENIAPEPISWVFFEVVDEDGVPVADEMYRAELPDGSVREGRVNNQGKGQVQLVGVEEGSCIVSFPKIDKNDWLTV